MDHQVSEKSQFLSLRNETGGIGYLAMLGIIIAIGIATVRMRESGKRDLNYAAKESKELLATAEANQIMAVAGFLVANSIVACKEGDWSSGGKKRCRWEGDSRKDSDFRMDAFGLANLRYDDNKLVFDLDPRKLRGHEGQNVVVEAGKLSFELVDARSEVSLKNLFGAKPKELERVDRDDFMVLATVALKYQRGHESDQVKRHAAFKRPMSIIQTTLRTEASCTSLCNVALSQNPFPSCRGPNAVDPNAVVQIYGTTTNLGPGVVYDLSYKREICLKRDLYGSSTGANCQPMALAGADVSLKVPVTDYIAPDRSINWADTAPCNSFVATTTNRDLSKAPQHVTDAGKIEYILDASSQQSNIEPFRLNQELDKKSGKLAGRLNFIYVVPPH